MSRDRLISRVAGSRVDPHQGQRYLLLHHIHTKCVVTCLGGVFHGHNAVRA
jgi:hypothetical protein